MGQSKGEEYVCILRGFPHSFMVRNSPPDAEKFMLSYVFGVTCIFDERTGSTFPGPGRNFADVDLC